jgi:polyhydroxyalkanoate synthesis regulator phasin
LKKNKQSKKFEITLDKVNSITTRKFKQCDEKLESLDKNLQSKIGNVEATVTVALKNNKESLYNIVTAFEMRIKD